MHHTIREGDTIWSITRKYTPPGAGMSGADWNDLFGMPHNIAVLGSNPGLLTPGETLSIPASWIRAWESAQ